jgi:hypothetical protein
VHTYIEDDLKILRGNMALSPMNFSQVTKAMIMTAETVKHW